MKKNYNHYRFTRKQWALYLAEGVLLVVILNYLFYQSLFAFLFLFPIPLFYLIYRKKQLIKEQKKQLQYQFRDALSALCVALRAGYSLENAIEQAKKDLRKLYGEERDMVREFAYISQQLRVSVPIEKLLEDLGNRSHVEDIANFATIVAVAKRTGGDVVKILQQSAHFIEDKIQVKKEIDAGLAAKKLEQRIMSIMPFGIIVYMQISSPGFLDTLYGTILGVVVMTLCLILYTGAFWLGEKIVEIEV